MAVLTSLAIMAGTTNSDIYSLSLKAAVKSNKEYKVKNGMLISYKGDSEVYIRNNVSAVATSAFDDDKVTSFLVSSSNKYFKAVDGVLYTKDGKRLVRYPSGRKGSFTVPNTVTYIAQYAFTGCKNLTNVNIPSSVTGIGSSAFVNCKNLQSINLPNGIEKIADDTFSGCRSLKNIVLSQGVKSIGSAAFYGCSNLTEIKLPSSVKKIRNLAFSKCKSLESIVIPENVKTIETSTFSKCTSLKDVTLNNSIEKIANNVFEYCTSLKEISIPDSVDDIGTYAFKKCTNLEKVILPEGIEIIKYGVFKGCTNLKKIKLPESTGYIDNNAFKDCISLETINIPEKTEVIRSSAFENAVASFNVNSENSYFSSKNGVLYNKTQTVLLKYPCYKQGDYTTPDELKKISTYAFKSCKKLGKVTVSEGIKKFSKECLTNSSIKKLSLPESLSKISIRNVYSNLNTINLKSVTVPDANENFCSVNGLLYSKDKRNLYIYPSGKTGTIKFAKEVRDLSAVEYANKAFAFEIEEGSKNFATDDGMVTNLKRNKILFVPAAKTSYTLGSSMKNIDALNNAKPYMDNFKSFKVSKDNSKYRALDGVLYSIDGGKLIDYPAAKSGKYKIPLSVTSANNKAFTYSHNLKSITITKNVFRCNLMFTDCGKLEDITIKEGNLRNIIIDVRGNTELQKITFPSSLVSCNVHGRKGWHSDLVISGWTNTVSEQLARKLGVKFISMGLVPNQVKGVKARAYVHGRRVRITWKKDEQVSGYEIYTDNEKLKDIKDNQVTKADIYVGMSSYNVLYIRAYKIQNGKKMYGKAKKIIYTNY